MEKCKHAWRIGAITNVEKSFKTPLQVTDEIVDMNLMFYCKYCLEFREKSYKPKNANLEGKE